MSAKIELQAIKLELEAIKKSKSRISIYVDELVKYSSFKIGDRLKGDKVTYRDKEFIVDKVGVCGNKCDLPTHFYARGYILKDNGELSKLTTSCSEKIIT